MGAQSLAILFLAVGLFSFKAKSYEPNQMFFKIAAQDESYELDNLGKWSINIWPINTVDRRTFDSPLVSVTNAPWLAAEIETRGQGCLVARRKCFSVKLDKAVKLKTRDNKKISLKHFDLLSLREDWGLSSLDLGMAFYQQQDLLPLKREYTELHVNGRSKGPYYAIQAPNHYFKKIKTPFAGRPTSLFYNFSSRYYKKDISQFSEKDFLKAHDQLVSLASKYKHKGRTLYNLLKTRMDIDAYLKYLVLNTFLRNGDYGDEFYFYADPKKAQEGQIYFKVMAWDPDALFQLPHSTPYNTLFWKNRITNSLFYSMENKFDRKLYKDPYIHRMMAYHLRNMLTIDYTPSKIKEIVARTKKALEPYLTNRALVMTVFDSDRTQAYSKAEINSILKEKERRLIRRRVDLLKKAILMLKTP